MGASPKAGGSRRTIILLSVFSFLIWASMGILAPIEVLFLDTLVESATAKGLILGIPSMVILALSPLAVKLSDRHGRKRVMMTLVLISAPFFAMLPYSPTYHIYGLIKVASSMFFLTTPIILAYLSNITKRLGIGYGSIMFSSSIGGSFGALSSGAVGEAFGLTAPYFLLVALVLASLMFILPLGEFRSPSIPRKPGKAKKLDMFLLAVLVNALFFSVHFSARGVVWPLVLAGISSTPALLTGIVFSSMGITAAMLSVPAGIMSERFREQRVFFLGWLIMGIMGVLLFFATGDVLLFLAFSILFSVGEILKGPSGSMIIARYEKSVYFGYASSIGAIGGIAGAVASGLMIDFLGINTTVLMLGLFVLVPLIPFLVAYFVKSAEG